MANKHIKTIALLRLSILTKGESLPSIYWDSKGLNPTAQSDLSYIFPRTSYIASLTHAKELARAHHDATTREFGVYHLFRLPTEMESEIHSYLLANTDQLDSHIPFSELDSLPEVNISKFEGAVDLGEVDLSSKKDISTLAHTYKSAMDAEKSSSPFFTLKE